MNFPVLYNFFELASIRNLFFSVEMGNADSKGQLQEALESISSTTQVLLVVTTLLDISSITMFCA